jgi:hypothetical protein
MSAAFKVRIEALNARLTDLFSLLQEYEQLLLLESDPRKRLGDRKNIDDLKAQIGEAEGELNQLQAQESSENRLPLVQVTFDVTTLLLGYIDLSDNTFKENLLRQVESGLAQVVSPDQLQPFILNLRGKNQP